MKSQNRDDENEKLKLKKTAVNLPRFQFWNFGLIYKNQRDTQLILKEKLVNQSDPRGFLAPSGPFDAGNSSSTSCFGIWEI